MKIIAAHIVDEIINEVRDETWICVKVLFDEKAAFDREVAFNEEIAFDEKVAFDEKAAFDENVNESNVI